MFLLPQIIGGGPFQKKDLLQQFMSPAKLWVKKQFHYMSHVTSVWIFYLFISSSSISKASIREFCGFCCLIWSAEFVIFILSLPYEPWWKEEVKFLWFTLVRLWSLESLTFIQEISFKNFVVYQEENRKRKKENT